MAHLSVDHYRSTQCRRRRRHVIVFFSHFDKTPLQSCARLLQLKRPPRGLVCTSTPSYFDHWVLVIAEWHSSTCDVFWNGNYMMRQFYRYVHTTLHSTLFNADLLRSPSPYPTAPLPRRSVVKFGIYLFGYVTFLVKHYCQHWNNAPPPTMENWTLNHWHPKRMP